MKRIFFALLVCVSIVFAAQAQKLQIQKASQAPLIDGVIDANDPWQSDKWILQDKTVAGYENFGMKSEFQLMWDDDYLYFAVKVQDSVRVDSIKDFWKNDGVTLYISLDTTQHNQYYSSQHGEYTFIIPVKGTTVLLSAYKDYGIYYVIEYKVLWSTLYQNLDRPWDGQNFRFEVLTMDTRLNDMGSLIFQNQQWSDTSMYYGVNGKKQGLVTLFDPQNSRKLQYIFLNPLYRDNSLPEISYLCGDVPYFIFSNSGLEMQFQSSNEKVAIVIGDKIHPVGAGECTITANQAGNENYKPAKSVSFKQKVNAGSCRTIDMTIEKTTISPVIDGKEDIAWQPFAWQEMDVNRGENANRNNTAKFKMSYDNDFFYVLVNIVDETIDTSQSQNLWEKDCVELYFTMDTNNMACNYNVSYGFWMLRKIFGRAINDYPMKGFEAKEKKTLSGYMQEWKLPIDSMLSTMDKYFVKFDNKNFRFEIANQDNDGSGRLSQLFWNDNSDDVWCSSKHFGYVALGSESNNLRNIDVKISVSIYPNPASNRINIKSADNINTVGIYSLNGQMILSKKLNEPEASINLSGIAQGLYFLKIQTGKRTMIEKLIINK